MNDLRKGPRPSLGGRLQPAKGTERRHSPNTALARTVSHAPSRGEGRARPVAALRATSEQPER